MTKLSVNQVLLKANSHEKRGETLEAKNLYKKVLNAYPKNKRAQMGLAALNKPIQNIIKEKPNQNIIIQLVNLYNQGKLNLAIKHSQKLIQEYPKAFIIWNILGGANKGLGRVEEAVKAFKKVVELNPKYAEGYNNLGATLQEQGKLENALMAYQKALSIKPLYVEAYCNMGNVLKDQGKLNQALEAYQKALLIKPDYAEAYNNYGNTLVEQGKSLEAITAYQKALSISPNYADANYNMGFALSSLGRPEEAIVKYNKAISIRPKYPEAYSNLGNAFKILGKLKEAIHAYNMALSINPNYAEAYNNLGNAFQDQDKLEEAMESYSTATSILSSYSEAWTNGSEALEKWNKLERLEIWLQKAQECFQIIPPDIAYFQAKILWRKKEEKEALKLILTIDLMTISDSRKQGFLNLKAKCFETLKEFSKAYECFSDMNLLAKKSSAYLNANSEKFFNNIKDQNEQLKHQSILQFPKNQIEVKEQAPVFLVGFPRSGTTLMDTILRSHSAIEVLEEKATIVAAKTSIRKYGYTNIHNQIFSSDILSDAKNAYYLEAKKHIKKIKIKSVCIDKLPLNLVEVPLIHQLFPNAKFILALRHPFDTILSCWMQDFELNAAMANMVDLDRIVQLYCIAMETFKICCNSYNLNVHTIRYEDLLEDLKGESSSLLEFLDLKWEPQMEDYRTTALNRGRINTPSYSQVSQPIYKDAKYRWINYKDYLEKYLDQIEPWIEEFAYEKY